MLKTKICFTVFVVYEIIAVILLHDMYTCRAMFSPAFCVDSGFKYFLFCIAIPMLALVIGLWINEIFAARRRRHSLLHRAGDVMSDVATGIKHQIGKAFDMRDMDKYLAAAILFGLKRYSDAHPQIRRTINEIISNANGHENYGNYDEYDTDDADTDIDDDDMSYRTRTNQNRGSSSGNRRTGATRNTTTNTRITNTRQRTTGRTSR